MIVRRLVVFSGIDTRVVNRLAAGMRSAATDIAFVRLDVDGLSEDYFSRLTERAVAVAQRILRPDVRLLSLLVSCASTDEERALERDFFFPALRRLELPRECRRDVNQFSEVLRRVQATFASDTYKSVVKRASPQGEARLLLPIRNSGLDRLRRHFVEIYEMRQTDLSRRIQRDVAVMRRRRGYRIRNLDFAGAINDGTHPIRRCTDSAVCDLACLMRFGAPIPDRFEFDVSCSTGLAGMTFYLCDGTRVIIPRGASHLNMRMNDDFLAA
jgi:hypothetical protein